MPAFRGPDGKIVYVADDEASRFDGMGGYQRVGDVAAGAAQNKIAPTDGGIAGSIGATLSAGLSGATLGASDWLLKGSLNQGAFEQMAQDRADSPVLSGAAQFAGALVPAVVSGGSITPSGYLSHLAAEGIGAAEAGGGALGAAKSLAIAGSEGALQNAGAYLSDVALGDRDLTAEGMVGALGTGFAFGGGGLVAAHGIQAGTMAARRMFARYAAGGEQAAQEAQAAWQAQSAKALESFDQTAELAKAKLQEAQLARQQADLARKQAAAATVEARVAPMPEPGVAPEAAAAGLQTAPPAASRPEVEIAGLLHDRAMAAADPKQLAAWDAQNGPRLREMMAARQSTPVGVYPGAEPGGNALDALAQAPGVKTYGPETLVRDRGYQRIPGATQEEAELGSKLAEYQDARAAFDEVHGRVDPDLDDLLRGSLGGDVQRPPVPVGEFGAPGARGYKPGEIPEPGPPSQAPLEGAAQGTPVTRALRKGAAGEPTKAFDFKDSGLTFDPETRSYFHPETPSAAREPPMATIGDKYGAAGGVVVNGEGKIAIVKTKGGHDEWVLPKGRIDPGETPSQAAMREVLEESGAHADVGPHIGDYEGRHSNTRFYLMRHAGDDLSAMAKDGEMAAVKFVTPDEAEKLLSHPMNKRALADARKVLDEHGPDFWSGAHVTGRAAPLSDGEFSKYAQQWQSRLSPEATKALEAYSRNGTFSLINAPLRTSGELSDVEPYLHGVVADMDKAIASAPAPRELLTFRGVNGKRSTAQWADVKVGDVVVDHGFGSTSADPGVGESFAKGLGVRGGVELRVTVPKGYPAAPVPSAIFGSEKELLLPRNTKYTVTKVETAPGGKIVHVTASAAAPGEKSAVGAALVPTDIKDMNLKQLAAHIDALDARRLELDWPGKRGPELDRVRRELVEAYDRHSAIRRGDVTEPSGKVTARTAAPTEAPARPLSDSEFKSYKKEWGHAGSDSFAAEMHYSKGGDEIVNSELRSGEPLSPAGQKIYDGLSAAFDLPESRLPRDVEVYRGVSDDPSKGITGNRERYANVKPGDVLEDPAFLSTAYSATAKSRNEQIVFTIRAKAGMPALPIRGHFDNEGELLFPPGTKLRVDKVELIPLEKRWDMQSQGGTKWETLPDGSTRFTERDGSVHVKPPIKDIHATVISDHVPPAVTRPAPVGLDAPIDQLSTRQLLQYKSALNDAFDRVPKGSPEYQALLAKDDAATQRIAALDEKQIAQPEHEFGATPKSPDDLLSALQGTSREVNAGKSIGQIGAESPARAEYVTQRAAKQAEDRAYFRGKAIEKKYAGSAMADEEGAALNDRMDRWFADFNRPKSRSEYVRKNLQQAMREEGSHAAAIERLDREWSDLGGQHPLAVKQLEVAHDAAVERAAAAKDPAERAAAEAEARTIEQQMTAVGSKPGAVEDVAALAPVVHRLEKAAADLTEALGEVAPAAAREHAAAFRQAEDVADQKSMSRAARAADDHAAAREKAQAAELLDGPSARERAIASAKRQRAEAESAYQKARVAEAEASIGAKRAKQAASDARASLPQRPSVAPTAQGTGVGHRVVQGAHALGYAAELGSDLGIPGIPRPHDIPVIGPLLSAYLKYRAFRAAAGRFVGRVPATAETKAAALAAKTRDGVARAVDRSLGLIERNQGAVRTAMTIGAIRANEALSRRALDDGHPDAPGGASVQTLAATRMREVAAAVANPSLITDMVRQQTRDVMDPDLITALENHLIAMFQHLNDTAPKLPQPNPYTKQQPKPSPADALQWGQRLAVANDPHVAFEMLQANALTPAAADTWRAVYPKLFAEAQQRIIARAADLKHPVEYRQLLQSALLFDVPLHASLDPENAAVMSQAHVPSPAPQAPAPGATPPVPGIASPTNLNSLYQTTADRRAAR